MSYPRHVHMRGGVYLIVESERELAAARDAGWADLPHADWPVPDEYREWVDGMPLPHGETVPDVPVTKPRGKPRTTQPTKD